MQKTDAPHAINANRKPEHWPATDQSAWAVALHHVRSPFRSDGGGPDRAPATIRLIQNCYGRYISFMTYAYPELLDLPPCSRLQPNVLDDYFGHLQEMGSADYTVVLQFDGLRRAMCWMYPQEDLRFITSPDGVPLTARLDMVRRPKLVPHDAVLLACARELFMQASSCNSAPARRAHVREAVAIGLLATMAPRVRTLSLLELGRHVRRVNDEWIVEQTPDITKTGKRTNRSILMPVEPEVATWLTRYVEVERREMIGRAAVPSNRLFVTQTGRPQLSNNISDRVGIRTKKALGTAVYPQTFRSSLATTAAIEGSAYPIDMTTILGHTDPRMTRTHYNRANGMAAGRRHSQRIKDMRKQLTDEFRLQK